MLLFDASNRDQCEVKRLNTNTPLQALIMMNDPTTLEASRVLAQELDAGSGAAKDKIALAFRRIICRKASDREMQLLQAYYDEQLKLFAQKQLDAGKTLKVGEYPGNDKLNKETSAALMKTINTIYNLEEAISKT